MNASPLEAADVETHRPEKRAVEYYTNGPDFGN